MEERITVNYDKKPAYDIVYKKDFDSLGEELTALDVAERKICIVTDSTVEQLYAQEVAGVLQKVCQKVVIFSFPAGEESKTLDTVRNIYTFLIQEGFERSDMLAALGGGVTGDMCGFAAATYLRGIRFIQIPTTLLSQVDSSIGGKTGVDFDRYKNMVGAFHMPKLVYMNLSVLRTLDARQYYSGMGEVMKAGLIRDAVFYEWLISNLYEICDRDTDTLMEMVYRSCLIKKAVVEKDPLEQGDRALLNFGHTLGHAIEKYKNFELLHGECVALGCVAAAYISWKHELLSMDEYYEIRDMFVPFHLPISMDRIEPKKIVALTKSDKKMQKGGVRFVLLKKIGKAFIDTTVSDQDMMDALNELNFDDKDEKA